MKASTDLEPCPFCGGPVEDSADMFPEATEEQRKHLIVRCANPKCAGSHCEVNRELWNRRPDPVADAAPVAPPEPVGELRDWIELLRLLAEKGEMLVMGRLTELADYLETLGDRQVMREALTLILSNSGLDNVLVKGADKFVFARMGDIHQTAGHALDSTPPHTPALPPEQGEAAAEAYKLHSIIISELANIVRMGQPEGAKVKWARDELIERQSVMGAVLRIRDASDKLAAIIRQHLAAQEGPKDEGHKK